MPLQSLSKSRSLLTQGSHLLSTIEYAWLALRGFPSSRSSISTLSFNDRTTMAAGQLTFSQTTQVPACAVSRAVADTHQIQTVRAFFSGVLSTYMQARQNAGVLRRPNAWRSNNMRYASSVTEPVAQGTRVISTVATPIADAKDKTNETPPFLSYEERIRALTIYEEDGVKKQMVGIGINVRAEERKLFLPSELDAAGNLLAETRADRPKIIVAISLDDRALTARQRAYIAAILQAGTHVADIVMATGGGTLLATSQLLLHPTDCGPESVNDMKNIFHWLMHYNEKLENFPNALIKWIRDNKDPDGEIKPFFQEKLLLHIDIYRKAMGIEEKWCKMFSPILQWFDFSAGENSVWKPWNTWVNKNGNTALFLSNFLDVLREASTDKTYFHSIIESAIEYTARKVGYTLQLCATPPADSELQRDIMYVYLNSAENLECAVRQQMADYVRVKKTKFVTPALRKVNPELKKDSMELAEPVIANIVQALQENKPLQPSDEEALFKAAAEGYHYYQRKPDKINPFFLQPENRYLADVICLFYICQELAVFRGWAFGKMGALGYVYANSLKRSQFDATAFGANQRKINRRLREMQAAGTRQPGFPNRFHFFESPVSFKTMEPSPVLEAKTNNQPPETPADAAVANDTTQDTKQDTKLGAKPIAENSAVEMPASEQETRTARVQSATFKLASRSKKEKRSTAPVAVTSVVAPSCYEIAFNGG